MDLEERFRMLLELVQEMNRLNGNQEMVVWCERIRGEVPVVKEVKDGEANT